MNEITQSSRMAVALQVIQLMNEGLTVKAACLEVGMPRSTFYSILARDREAIAQFQDMVIANDRIQLWTILTNKTDLLEKVIADGLAEATKPRDRLAIIKFLNDMLDKLADKLRLQSYDDKAVAELLKGPSLHNGVSRFAAVSSEDEAAIR